MRISLEKIGLSFDFPKPVGLIAHLIRAFSGEDDWILDSFAGSGTTGQAVMNVNKEDGTRRKFILIELNQDTANNVIIPRMRALIDGNKEAGFQQHGGGFRYYRLAPSLLEKDRWDNWVIAKDYNAAMLAEAICKLMGFTYAPSESHYWMHGHSSETDYIYVTTQSLTHEQIAAISEEVGEARSLLVCCKAFNANSDAFQNLTVKKIPQAVLRKCEWGKDDYSLKVENLPMSAPAPTPEAKPARHVKASTAQPSLFSEEV
jgi:adenine-specific DNA-methyltransferase